MAKKSSAKPKLKVAKKIAKALPKSKPVKFKPWTPAEVTAYQGADRSARLIEGAKREGTLSLYTSRVAEDTNPVIDAFSKKYGIDVSVWRAANRTVLMSPTEMLDNGKKWTALWEKTVIRPQ